LISAWQVYISKLSEKGKTTEKQVVQTMHEKVCIGRVPVMVKSRFCNLVKEPDKDLKLLKSEADCAFDIGGYFVIKGSEKVRNT